jgi:hypothetical protein
MSSRHFFDTLTAGELFLAAGFATDKITVWLLDDYGEIKKEQ